MGRNSAVPPELDVDEIKGRLLELGVHLDNYSILILGGSGYIGRWMFTTLYSLKRSYFPSLKISVVSRDINSDFFQFFRSNNSNSDIRWILHDFEKSKLKIDEKFNVVLHLANSSSLPMNALAYTCIAENVHATITDLVQTRGEDKQITVLHLSSGAVYGRNILHDNCVSENEIPYIDSNDVYARGKLCTEEFLEQLHQGSQIQFVNARLFNVYGPALELTKTFAITEFLRSALESGTIYIKGNRNTKRSFLYITDLCVYLTKMITKPCNSAINIGGKTPVSLQRVAEEIQTVLPSTSIRHSFRGSILKPTFYYPCTQKLEEIYGSEEEVSLSSGLSRWVSESQTRGNY